MRTYKLALRRAEKHLSAADSKLAAVIESHGRCELVPAWERSPYESLMRAVAHQQLHGRAAEAILKRLTNRFPDASFPEPSEILQLPVDEMRSFGFSQAKVATLRGIAEAALSGVIPPRAAAEALSDEELITQISAIRGIGRWTVEMLLIFTLGRLDIMPVDDFGVKVGLQSLRRMKTMPTKHDFQRFTAGWAPYRSIGAWYLWRIADQAKADKKPAKK